MRSSSISLKALAAITVLALGASCGGDDGSAVSLSEPAGGATVAGGVALTMRAEGLTIEAAGEAREGAGHFHVIADAGCLDAGDAIPKDADHVHFGKGQSDGTIYLTPGEHELCLQAGDGVHSVLDATDTVKLTVGIASRDEWCAVVAEVDEMFETVDGSDDDFAVKQLGYENIRRLITQLTAAMEQVDADARAGVKKGLEFAISVVTVLTEAKDMAAAEEALQPVYAGGEDATAMAQPWILDHCGIDIDG